MKKIAILITSMLLFASVVCIIPASESDGAEVTRDKALLYEVYKIDVTARSAPNMGWSTHTAYFLSDDEAGKNGFEEALRNRETLPPSANITWMGEEIELTVYVLGPPLVTYSSNNTNVYLYWYGTDAGGNYWYTYVYFHEKDRMTEFSSSVYLLSGQTVKITVPAILGDVTLGFGPGQYGSYEDIEEGVNEFEISKRGNYGIYVMNGAYTSAYISYTIEYEDSPTNTSAYGYAFLAVGIVFLAILIWFALPQRINE